MNKERRKRIETIADVLSEKLEELEALRDEEQEAYDNLPEGLSQGEKGQSIESAIYCLDDATSGLEAIRESLMEAIEQ